MLESDSTVAPERADGPTSQSEQSSQGRRWVYLYGSEDGRAMG